MPQPLDYNAAEWKRIFNTLLDQIDHQQCVLLLGPELAQLEGQPIQQQLREQLLADYATEISYYYPRDGLFLFTDELAKGDVQGGVRLFYKNPELATKLNETIFKKIAQIPFHLVLSISPDNFLSDVCYKYGVKHRSAFFHHRGDAVQLIDPPSKEIPLVYQLFGRFSQDDSLVLDYEDLFRLLQAGLGAPGLPEKLRAALDRAKTFIFLGFDFEKWYSQLLLRLLTGEKAIRKYALNTQIAESQTHTFLVKQFEIAFLGDEMAFFEHLYQECQQRLKLRQLTEPNSPAARQVIQLVQEGEPERALEVLKGLPGLDSSIANDIVMLSARYLNLKQNQEKGLMDSRDYWPEFNRIIDAILELSQHLP